MNPNRRRGLSDLGVMLLAYEVFNVMGTGRIPPITLAIVGFQTAIYLRLFTLPWFKASQVCISVYNVWYRKDYKRLLYGALEHGDDMHLYYNMISFIMKGQALERRFGSVKFLYLTSIFTILTSVTYIGLNLIALEFDNDFGNQCAVGFSGVIFALKVLTSYYNPGYSRHIMGIPVLIPTKYAVWVELVLIQVVVPNASFLGHLAGILVGLAYVKGPLGPLLDFIYSTIVSLFDRPTRPQFTPRAEASGYRTEQNYQRYSQYVPPNMDEEEQFRRATEESLRNNMNYSPNSRTSSMNNNLYPSMDEIRARRLARYQ